MIDDFETRMYWLVIFIDCYNINFDGRYNQILMTQFKSSDVSLNYVSIQTGSGFAVSDYDLWPAAAQMMSVIYFIIFGGCSGSTTGA